MNENLTRVGLDVGFGDVKLAYHEPEKGQFQTIIFPAILVVSMGPAVITLLSTFSGQ